MTQAVLDVYRHHLWANLRRGSIPAERVYRIDDGSSTRPAGILFVQVIDHATEHGRTS